MYINVLESFINYKIIKIDLQNIMRLCNKNKLVTFVKKTLVKNTLLVFICFCFLGCKKAEQHNQITTIKNEVKYAKGFSIENYKNYTVVTVKNPWPNATKSYKYICKKKNAIIPDSLQKYVSIAVPIKKIVVTSTTHIPSLEMLDEEKSLVGFPHLDYISSDKIRKQIDKNKVVELGTNQSLNTELLINLQPDVIIGYGLDNNNPTLDNLQKSGLKVLLNGDWNESTPLGKAEWLRFFGVLFDNQKKATELFYKIENEYLKTVEIAKRATQTPTVLAGDIFEGKWYLPSGTSWGSLLIKEANAHYLWADTKGTGSLSLSFETVFEKANNADLWITSGQFSSLKQMTDANVHYSQFKAFKKGEVYSFNAKKGKTGGSLYYELAPNRPDIVIKDLVKILHPELLINYKPYFFEKLK